MRFEGLSCDAECDCRLAECECDRDPEWLLDLCDLERECECECERCDADSLRLRDSERDICTHVAVAVDHAAEEHVSVNDPVVGRTAYPELHTGVQVLPENVTAFPQAGLVEYDVEIVSAGLAQLVVTHAPAAAERLPRLHVTVSDPPLAAKWPDTLHAGVQLPPLAIDEEAHCVE